MREPVKRDHEELWSWNERYDNYKALVTRCRIHEMRNSKRNVDKFPYTAEELAIYMDYICDEIRPESEDDI